MILSPISEFIFLQQEHVHLCFIELEKVDREFEALFRISSNISIILILSVFPNWTSISIGFIANFPLFVFILNWLERSRQNPQSMLGAHLLWLPKESNIEEDLKTFITKFKFLQSEVNFFTFNVSVAPPFSLKEAIS